jgi:hypothetical protein
MMQDTSPRAAPSTLEPTASLTSVRVKRRKLPVAPTGKRGDLTQGGAPAPELGLEPVIALPPPVERALVQEILPFAEVMLPELMDEPAADMAPAAPILEATPEEEPAEELEPLDLLLAEALEAPAEAEATPEPEPEPASEPEHEARPALHLVETEASPPLSVGPADAALPEAEPELSAEPDILDYWDSLRGGRDVPPLDELDRAHVGATWPNTLLVAIDAADLPRITRLGADDGEIDYTVAVIDWIMSRGRTSAKRAEPMEEERRFAVADGTARYRLLLLPMSSYGLASDHVLCQLSHIPEIGTVASIKRWLAW